MVKKLQKLSAEKKNGSHLSGTVKDSAQQIWLAGLGAFAKAQEEGNKVFDTLVKEGLSIQRKTQAVAEEKISEATSKVTHMASGIGFKAVGQWDKLESIFEDRVAKALAKLGVPSAKDLAALSARVDALSKSAKPTAKAAAQPAAKPAAPRTSAKKTPAKKAAQPAAKAAKPAVKPAAKPAAKRAPQRAAVATVAASPAAATTDADNLTA